MLPQCISYKASTSDHLCKRWWVKHYVVKVVKVGKVNIMVVKVAEHALCSHFHCQTPRYPHSLPSELCLHSQATMTQNEKIKSTSLNVATI